MAIHQIWHPSDFYSPLDSLLKISVKGCKATYFERPLSTRIRLLTSLAYHRSHMTSLSLHAGLGFFSCLYVGWCICIYCCFDPLLALSSCCCSYGNMALFYHGLNQTELALQHMSRTLLLLSLSCGSDHPDVAATFINVAMMYQDINKMNIALRYLQEALKKSERLLGREHIQTAVCYHALAIAFNCMGAYKLSLQVCIWKYLVWICTWLAVWLCPVPCVAAWDKNLWYTGQATWGRGFKDTRFTKLDQDI